MTELLQKAFDEARKLPDADQNALAARLLEDIADEQWWTEAFAKSPHVLERLADEARAEIAQGKTFPLEDLL